MPLHQQLELPNIKKLVPTSVGVQHSDWKNYESTEPLLKTLLCLHCNLRVVNTHPALIITPTSICAQPPKEGQIMPKICRGIGS
jgi:hypothetical protein